MPTLPSPLLTRLSPSDRAALDGLLCILDHTLRDVYREAVLDHQESRGDDAQLFGFKVYKHARFALTHATEADDDVHVLEHNGAYCLAIGPLRVRVDSLGHFAHE